jgi:hypothetical protein
MAQSRERRNQRSKQRSRPPSGPSGASQHRIDNTRRRNLKRLVVAFLLVVGLAGVLAISTASDDSSGAPAGGVVGVARVGGR